jgi:hypothetical protein
MRFMMLGGSTGGICRAGKTLTLTLSAYTQQIENSAIVHRKSPNSTLSKCEVWGAVTALHDQTPAQQWLRRQWACSTKPES